MVAKAVLAPPAIIAASVAYPGIEEDPGPGWVTGGALTLGQHHPGAVGAADVGQADPRDPVADEEVEVVQGGRPQPDQHLARPGSGSRHLLVAEHLGPAVLVEANRLDQ